MVNEVIKETEKIKIELVNQWKPLSEIEKILAADYGKYYNLRDHIGDGDREEFEVVNVVFMKSTLLDSNEYYDVILLRTTQGTYFTTSSALIKSMEEYVKRIPANTESFKCAVYGRKSLKRKEAYFLDCALLL